MITRHRTLIARVLATLLILSVSFPLLAGAQAQDGGLVPCGFDTDNNDRVDQSEECGFDDLLVLIGNVLRYLIYTVATPLAAIMFAIAGFFYLTAGDDAGKVKTAHGIFISVLWGFGTMLIAWALVSFIINFFTDEATYSLLQAPAP